MNPIRIAQISVSVPLKNGLKWTGGGPWIYEEKKDGVRALLSGEGLTLRASSRSLPGTLPANLSECVFDGELCHGVYWVFDLLVANGQDIRKRPLRERKSALLGLSTLLPEWMPLIPSGNGGEYLEAVLAAGGEGVVAKHIESRYGELDAWVKCKRIETHDCLVSGLHPEKSSAHLMQFAGGGEIDCGWVQVKEGMEVGPGTVVEIACHSRHKSGKFREPRILRIRTDKPVSECVC